MKTNSERAGDRVFANVDRALAGRIISRSRENSRETGPAVGGSAVNLGIGGGGGVGDGGAIGMNDFPRFLKKLMPVVKVAAAALALLVLMKVVFGRKGKGRG